MPPGLPLLHHTLVAFLLATPCLAQDPPLVREGPRRLDAPAHLIGRRIPDIPFTDLDGRSGKLSDYADSALLVLCMSNTECPIAKKYTPRLVELEARYRQKRVTFLLVNSQEHETPEQMRAAELQATSTTEVFVLDAARTLVYRGAVDDQYGLGFTLPEARRPLLTDAIDALLARQVPPVTATTAPGCELAVPDAALEAAATARASGHTWHNRISRIVQHNCETCHRPDAAGPFELLTFEDAKDHAKTIKREVERGAMPPWFADGPRGVWSNDARLTDEDEQDLIAWVSAGAPEGDPKDAPLPRTWAAGWELPEPDAVFEVDRTIAVAAQGVMPYETVTIRPNLDEDKWIGAVEVRTLQPAVVHHVLVFLDYPIDHPEVEQQEFNVSGTKGGFAWMVPGWTTTRHPPGMAKRLPRGVNLLVQLHYTPNGTAVEDRPSIAFDYVEKPIHELKTRVAGNTTFAIPAGASNYPVIGQYKFVNPASIVSFSPHTHVRGVRFRYDLIAPDGVTRSVLDLQRYDFNWQLTYTLAEPLEVPAGAILEATGWYDNSAKNPANPDPTKVVRVGQQTWDEMMLGFFTSYPLPTANPVPDPDQWAGLPWKTKLKKLVVRNPGTSIAGVLVLLGACVWFGRRRITRRRTSERVTVGSAR